MPGSSSTRQICSATMPNHYDKTSDTLDVWFDSGVTHACVLGQHDSLPFPADLYLEGSDQHRGWFQSSLLTSVAINGTAPYRSVLTHGFTVDANGRKMSKSLGNVVAPQKIMNSLGADILRLWVASTDYSAEITVSDEILKRTADTYRRIRNTVRFLLANLNGFDPAQHMLADQDMLSLDRWAVARAQQLQQQIIAAYQDYNFHIIYQKLHNFCAVDHGWFLSRYHQGPAVHHASGQHRTALRTDRAVPYCRSHVPLAGTDTEFHRR